MLTARENFLETLKPDGHPDRLIHSYDAFRFIQHDPISRFLYDGRVRGSDCYDRWGVYISFPADQPGPLPMVTEDNQVIQDMEEWESYVKAPDLRANCSSGWEKAQASQAAIDRHEYLSACIMGTGIFEQFHALQTFENALVSLIAYPEESQALIDYIGEYRLEYARLLVENLHPDVIISHDDFGSKHSLFMSPEMWRQYFKEPYRRLYRYLNEQGVIVVHHGDSFCQPIVEDLAEIGVNCWQGVLPTNDIPAMTRALNGRMALMGGVESVIDRADAGEKEIRHEVRRALESYGHLPHFIPGITYGTPGTIFPHVEPIIADEVARWNREKSGV